MSHIFSYKTITYLVQALSVLNQRAAIISNSPQMMHGQVGIVTGAGTPHGIGRELVKKLAQAGALAVYACDLNLGAVPSLQREIREAGFSTLVEGRLLDVSDEKRTQDIVKEVTKIHDRFDFFFANAGFANYR
jgi:NAD(P)-dependent dehydrogenase (short-subunit alcohol dehydrogenase family)